MEVKIMIRSIASEMAAPHNSLAVRGCIHWSTSHRSSNFEKQIQTIVIIFAKGSNNRQLQHIYTSAKATKSFYNIILGTYRNPFSLHTFCFLHQALFH